MAHTQIIRLSCNHCDWNCTDYYEDAHRQLSDHMQDTHPSLLMEKQAGVPVKSPAEQADNMQRATFDRNRLMQSLTNITPNDEEVQRIERVRMIAKELGSFITLRIEPGRERSLACTHLEETVMWAVKAILMEDPPAQATKNFAIPFDQGRADGK